MTRATHAWPGHGGRAIRGAILIVLTACAHRGPAPPAPAATAPPAAVAPATPVPGPQTVVVTLAPGIPTPVTRGPLGIWTINPGDALRLGVSASGRCDDVAAWFGYSGGGVAVADGQTLCALSSADEPVTHGFSGSTAR